MKKHLLAAALALAFSFPAYAQDASPPAPAADAGPKPGWMNYQNPYAAEQSNIVNAHRTSDEVLAWGGRAVADALHFPPGKFADTARASQKLFNRTGWTDYIAYLKDTKLLDVAQSGKYAVGAVADGEPMMLNSGAMNGAWHWEIKVPVITSITQKGADGEEQTVSTAKSRIRLLIARMPEGGGDDGMAIESWKTEAEKQ